MTNDQIDEFVAYLSEVMAFHQRDCSAFTTNVFWEALKGYDLDTVKRAFVLHEHDPVRGRFAPMPADVLLYLNAHVAHTARTAWKVVIESLGRHGGWRSVVFDDSRIHYALSAIGGWQFLSSEHSSEADKRLFEQFERHYNASLVQQTFGYPAVMVGRSDAPKVAKGLAPTPVLVGDPEQAKRVLDQGESVLALSVSPQT